jgi:hypothetical protein
MADKSNDTHVDPVARKHLTDQLMMVMAGHPVNVTIAANCDSLASALGFAASSLAEADTLVDAFAADIKLSIRTNWNYLQAMRLQSLNGVSHG